MVRAWLRLGGRAFHQVIEYPCPYPYPFPYPYPYPYTIPIPTPNPEQALRFPLRKANSVRVVSTF